MRNGTVCLAPGAAKRHAPWTEPDWAAPIATTHIRLHGRFVCWLHLGTLQQLRAGHMHGCCPWALLLCGCVQQRPGSPCREPCASTRTAPVLHLRLHCTRVAEPAARRLLSTVGMVAMAHVYQSVSELVGCMGSRVSLCGVPAAWEASNARLREAMCTRCARDHARPGLGSCDATRSATC